MRGLVALLTMFLCLPVFGQSLVHTNLVQPLGNKTIVGTNALKFSVLATNAATPATGNLTIFARTNDSSQVKFFSIDSAGTVTEWGSSGGGATNATFVSVNGTETDPLNFLNTTNVLWVVSGSNVTAVLTNVATAATLVSINGTETDPLNLLNNTNILWVVSGSNVVGVVTNIHSSQIIGGQFVLTSSGSATNLTLVTPKNSEWTNLYSQSLVGDVLTIGNSVIDGGTPFIREGIVLPNNGTNDENAVWEPTVLANESNPIIYTNESTVWKMWHTIGWTGGGTTMGYAESTNGYTWTRYANPVLTNHMRNCVINDGGTYVMYATSLYETNVNRFTSANGVSWTQTHTNVLTVGSSGAWDDGYLGNTFVWKRGVGDYVMFYDGRRTSTSWGDGYATSADGISWSKVGTNYVIGDGQGGPWVTNTTINGVATWIATVHGPPNSTALVPTDIYIYTTTNTVPTNFTRVGTYPVVARGSYAEGAFTANGQVADAWVVENGGRIYFYYEGGYDGATPDSPFDIYRAYTTLTWEELLAVAGEPDRFKFQGYGNFTQLELDGLYPLRTKPTTYGGTYILAGGIQNNDAGVWRIGYNSPGVLDDYDTTYQGGWISMDARPGYPPIQFFTRASGNPNEGYPFMAGNTNGWSEHNAAYSSNWFGLQETNGGAFTSYITNSGLFKVWTNNLPYYISETGITNSIVIVTNGSISSGQVPKWDGTRWYAASDNAGTNASEVFVNNASVAAPNFTNNTYSVWAVAADGTNVVVNATNLVNSHLASGAGITYSKLQTNVQGLVPYHDYSTGYLTTRTGFYFDGTALVASNGVYAAANVGNVAIISQTDDNRVAWVNTNGTDVVSLGFAHGYGADTNFLLVPSGGDLKVFESQFATNKFVGSVLLSNVPASKLLRTDANKYVADVTIGANLSFDGTTLSATGGGGSVYVNGGTVSNPNFSNGTYSVFTTGSSTNVFVTPTNIIDNQISASANIAATKLESAVIVSTEIDTSSEVAGIVGDETGTGALVYSSAPNLTNTVAYTLLNVTNGVLSMSGPLQYTSETISASDIDWSSGNSFYKQLGANTTFTFSGQQNDYNIRVFLEQDGTGGRTVTWPAGVVWLSTTNQSNSTAPNVDTNASRVTIVDLFRRNGTNYGTMFGANARPLEDIAGVVSAAAGDILYYTGTVWTNLARGTTSQVLTTTNNTIQWLNAAAGTGSGDVSYTAFATSQFGTNGGTVYVKDGAVVTNLNVRGNLTVTNSLTAWDITSSNSFSILGTLSADAMVISNWFQIPNLTNITVPSTTNGYLALDLDSDYSGVTNALLKYSAHGQSNWVVAVPGSLPSANGKIPKYNSTTKAFEWADDATGAGGGDPVLVNADAVADGSGVAFTNTSTLVWELDTAATPDLAKAYPTNLGAAQLATDSVSADELNAAGVEAELEAVIDLADLQGAVTDAQVPNNITIDLATTATTANAGDSATAFFSSGTIEHERGGLEADVSAYAGIVGITGGATLNIDTLAEFDTAIGITGTPAATNFWAGDNSWKQPTLGTDTVGSYAAGDAEGGAALTGDSATAFFSAGQIERARGGTGADTSAYGNGLLGSDGSNNTLDIDTISEFSTALGITGTPSASTYLRGDGTWATVSGSGDVSYTAFDPNQFGTNGGSIYIKDGAVVTNLNVRNNLTVTNAITAQSVTISNLTASQYVVTDANKQLATQSTLNDDDVAFDDADNLWTATAVGPALEELNDSINAGVPNGSGAKVHWSQLLGVPAGFADNTDDGGGGGDAVQVNGLAVTDALFTNSTTIVWYTNGTASTEILGYVTNVGAAQLATDSVSADELNASGVESELEAVLDLPDLQGVLLTAQLPTAYLGSWQITNALSVYDLTISNNFTIVSNLNSSSLYVTNDAVFKNVLTTNLYLTNGLTSGALFVGSGGLVTNQGTLDGSSTGVTLKFKQYIRLTHPHHGSSGAIIQTNNVNNEYFGYALFDDATDEASNYTEYHITVPEDIDTSVDLRVKLYYTTSAADTGTHKYVISHQDVADSADLFSVAMVEPVTLTDTAAGAGAGDTEIVGWTTLTSWRSNITAGNMWVIRIARDGNDASDGSTVDSYVSQIVIEYGATQ